MKDTYYRATYYERVQYEKKKRLARFNAIVYPTQDNRVEVIHCGIEALDSKYKDPKYDMLHAEIALKEIGKRKNVISLYEMEEIHE